MTQRTLAGLLAAPLFVLLWVVVLTSPLPFVTYSPGPTVDVLAEREGEEIVEVRGQEAFRDGGELRMTTVYVDSPEQSITLPRLIEAWWSPDQAVRPYDSVYPPGQTDEDKDMQSSVQMVSSQDVAIARALTALGRDVEAVTEVQFVTEGAPADGELEVRDVLLEVDGTPVEDPAQVADLVRDTEPGESVAFTVLRDGEERTVEVTPEQVEGRAMVGIVPGPGYDFPIDVDVRIPESIGGPSAGMVFALAIYDTLTPGSLTGGGIVAGTGTLDAEGRVGPIGGIQQKIAGAADAGSELFLVPAGNCADALGAPEADELRLVRVATFDDALAAVEDWAADPEADLPTCEEAS
jgi:Lon-like protease